MRHPSIHRLWDQYRIQEGCAPSEPPVAEHFCDNEIDANTCADLICSELKRATASALVSYQDAGEPLPKPGKLLIVTNWIGEARALIRTHRVMVYRFADVPATFAELEGEGDGTLAWWRATHRAFWERTLIDHVVDDDLRVVCEEFALLTLT
ncbi:ASCH domain-containing protein [Sphingomonas sp. BAUL-RG-20F-R05-02]|uniref:ASCH domain-containing protein n=1 Tax=Sphingomonas sp. BAUL-RG-20F-R05-02 TaxID=2914830 RepID=UPI00391F6451